MPGLEAGSQSCFFIYSLTWECHVRFLNLMLLIWKIWRLIQMICTDLSSLESMKFWNEERFSLREVEHLLATPLRSGLNIKLYFLEGKMNTPGPVYVPLRQVQSVLACFGRESSSLSRKILAQDSHWQSLKAWLLLGLCPKAQKLQQTRLSKENRPPLPHAAWIGPSDAPVATRRGVNAIRMLGKVATMGWTLANHRQEIRNPMYINCSFFLLYRPF